MVLEATILNRDDNVCVALIDLAPGMRLDLSVSGREFHVCATEPIKYQHKMAIVPILDGEKVTKYGEVIGVATKDIQAGEHVHTHNMTGLRAKPRQ